MSINILMSSFHTYLSNRISTPEEKSITTVAWNRVNNLIACGQVNGVITIASIILNPDRPGLFNIDINLTLVEHKHEITALCWNERFNKLLSGDSQGHLVVWIEHSGKWRPSMINDVYTSPIVSLSCSNNSELIAIIYEDGRIICGDSSGNQKWTTIIHNAPTVCCFSPSSKILFVGTAECQMLMVKSRGAQAPEMELNVTTENNRVMASSWSRNQPHLMLVAFQDGRLMILTSENDVSPITVDLDMEITDAVWSNSSEFIAVSGIVESGHCQLRFLSKSGKPIRTLNIPAQNISSISFNQNDTQLALGVDDTICLAQIVPINPWGYFDDTLVYSINMDEDKVNPKSDVIFFNSKTGEKHIKKITNLVNIAAGKSSVLLASSSPETQETALLLCNKFGIPLFSSFVPFLPTFFAVTSHYVISCSNQRMCLWDTDTDEMKYHRFKNEATAITARDTTLFVAFSSGELVMYGIPEFDEDKARYNLYSRIESIAVSTDLTRLSLIDVFGNMIFLDVHSGSVSEGSRKETWCMKWADDSPDLFVSLEKQKLYVYRDFEAIEPIISLTYICSFTDLVITAVDFITLYRDPLHPNLELFHRYESKPLRDVDYLLESTDVSIDEITAYIKTNSHPRLWLMLAETALDQMNLQLAERCFIESQNNAGITLMKKLSSLPKNGLVQRGFVLWYLKRYQEAEECFRGRFDPNSKQFKNIQKKPNNNANTDPDYTIQMYATIGDWQKVAELVNEVEDEEMFTRCHIALGNEAYMKGDWSTAASEYNIAHDHKKQLKALFRGDDFNGISRLCDSLKAKDPLLDEIGIKFVALGAHTKAVDAFMKLGDVQKAIDSCVHLNQWTMALQIADEHPQEVNKRALMGRYAHHLAENSHIAAAINMYVKYKLPREAALLLDKEGDIAFKQTRQYLFAKKCYVFSADLLEQSIKSEEEELNKLNPKPRISPTTATKVKTTVIKGPVSPLRNRPIIIKSNNNNNNNDDEDNNNTAPQAPSSPLEKSINKGKDLLQIQWHKAEALHFLILAHQQMYRGEWIDALITAARIFAVYYDIIGKDRSAALLALCGFNSGYLKQCSNGFIQLENSESLTKKNRQRMENMAVKIFGKHPPNDPSDLPTFECKNCKSKLVEPNCKCTCGYITCPSIVSGIVIPDVRSNDVWRCPKCHHYALQDEIKQYKVCPLCHTTI